MPLFTPFRALAASTVALAVTASVGIVLSTTPDPTVAVPATRDAAALTDAQRAERQALTTSRAAEREALQTALSVAVDETALSVAAEERNAALVTTSGAIDATEAAIQEQRAAEAAAAQAAAEKAAAEKAAAQKAAAQKAAAQKAAEKKATVEKKAAAPRGGSRAENRELGRQLASQLYGWGNDQFTCYDNIIMRESLWDATADNPTSSAYGIPQALPGRKMASEGADWASNPATQIKWGLKYVKDRYGTPCGAWSFKRANGWY